MSAQLVETIAEIRERVAKLRRSGQQIALVPTMGALHRGHARLIEAARADNDRVIVSVFVNPLQFAPSEDYGRYPRTLAADIELAGSLDADLVFAPAADEMYPQENVTFVEVSGLDEHLCGRFRPGHFRGVATVVSKLFHIVAPDRAYFGEKDLQQLAIIRRMATDLNFAVTVIGVPTVRENDGLALSSRNQYLNEAERKAAPALYRSLVRAKEAVADGERDAEKVLEEALAILKAEPLIRLQYFELVDENMQPIGYISGPAHAAAAIMLGSTRLIDNISLYL